MSFFDSASLVQIPSGYSDGTLYSVKPIDGTGDLTFSRGSDIEATRVNANGYIEKAKVNLLTYSNDFSNAAWTLSNTTVTGGQTGYDGSSDAWLLSKSASGGLLRQGFTSIGVETISVYAKAGTLNWAFVNVGGAAYGAYFDLSGSGAVGTSVGATIEASIVSLGGGWFRCVVAGNFSGSTNFRVYPADGDGDTSGTSGNIYIQDAQLNYGLVAQEYQETTTTSVITGITNDLPRLDYSGGASCPSLLLEPERTNLINNSEFYGAWTGSAVYTANTDVSPSGYQDAATLNDNTTAYLDRRKSPAITANTTHTFSVFVKKTTGSLTHYAGFGISLTGGSSVVDYGIINTTTGAINRDASSTINSVSYSSESYGNYWRVIMTFTDNQSNTLCTAIIYPAISTNGTSISPTAQGSNVFWGAQLEEGSYPTSIIPTYGTSLSRLADACSKTGISSLIGQTEGVVYFEGTIEGVAANTRRLISLSDGGNNNMLQVYNASNTNSLEFVVTTAGATQAVITASSAITFGQTFKFAFAYANNDFVFYVNGVQIGIDGSGSVPATSVVRFARGDGANLHEGTNSQLLLFPTRLSNADLATLTT